MRRHLIGLLCLSLVVGCTNRSPAAVTLILRSGTAAVARSDGKTYSLGGGQNIPIQPKDNIDLQEANGTLTFGSAATIKFEAVTHIDLTGDTLIDNQWQAELGVNASAGQLHVHLEATTVPIKYTFTTSIGTVTMTSTSTGISQALIWINESNLQIGMISGAATASNQDKTVTVHEGEGTVIRQGQTPDEPVVWGRVSVPLFRANDTSLVLPVTLMGTDSGAVYRFPSDQTYIVPPGMYTLLIDDAMLVQPYRADKIFLPLLGANTLSELPITFSEITFKVPEVKSLNIQVGDDKPRTIPANTRLLISPGTRTLNIARSDKPTSSQPLDINLLPGQSKDALLNSSLFGQARLQVKVLSPDNQAIPVFVNIYRIGSESGRPLLIFVSTKASDFLPEDKYVMTVTPQTGLAIALRAEFEVSENKIKRDQLPVQEIDFGQGILSFTSPRSGSSILIAQTQKMQELGINTDVKSINDARNKPAAGDYITVARTNFQGKAQVTVPEGQYTIVVDDQKDFKREGVQVTAEQIVMIAIGPSQ